MEATSWLGGMDHEEYPTALEFEGMEVYELLDRWEEKEVGCVSLVTFSGESRWHIPRSIGIVTIPCDRSPKLLRSVIV